MTNLRKAAEIALEALEWINRVNAMDYEYQSKAQEPIQALRQALAQPEQEKYVTKVVAMHEDGTYTTERIPLPKREWVDLTDEEGAEIWGDAHDIDWNRLVTPKEIVKRIEAKLKEKNGG